MFDRSHWSSWRGPIGFISPRHRAFGLAGLCGLLFTRGPSELGVAIWLAGIVQGRGDGEQWFCSRQAALSARNPKQCDMRPAYGSDLLDHELSIHNHTVCLWNEATKDPFPYSLEISS